MIKSSRGFKFASSERRLFPNVNIHINIFENKHVLFLYINRFKSRYLIELSPLKKNKF